MKSEYVDAYKSVVGVDSQLQTKTEKFWVVSKTWNGVHDEKITVSQAISSIRDLQANLNDERPLFKGLNSLKFDIVEHGTKKSKKKSKQEYLIETKLIVLA